MAIVTMNELLEAGVHFGHQTRRWDPKMKRYIFMERNGIYIIDLQKTLNNIEEAYETIGKVVERGETVLFVGTKKQAKDVIRREAERCGMFYVSERWLGGMLTNFQTIRQNIKHLNYLEKISEDGTYSKLTKKEAILLDKEREKLKKFLGGIQEMDRLPGLVYVVDTKRERISVLEASKLEIPIIAMLDTNCDPDPIDCPIPSNDDAIRSITLITRIVADAVVEAQEKLASVRTKEEET